MSPSGFDAKFWSQVNKGEFCWEWGGPRTTTGYGSFCVDHKSHYSHRVSYEMAKGEIPFSLHIDHLCRNKLCVNPEHLEAVTVQENITRGRRLQLNCKHGHPLSGDNLYMTPLGARNCRACQQIRYAKKKKRRDDAKAGCVRILSSEINRSGQEAEGGDSVRQNC